MSITEYHKTEIAEAMKSLCDTIGRLGCIRDVMEADLRLAPPGDERERTVLMMSRACTHLAHAAATVPQEMWNIMASRAAVAAPTGVERSGRGMAKESAGKHPCEIGGMACAL